MTTQTNSTHFSDIVKGFDRALKLGTVAELSRRPTITMMDVIACFADIRGFTKFVQESQNRASTLVADFLPDYFSIFSKAVLRERWNLEQNDSFQDSIREQIAPKLAKKLGDGMLLVWELRDSDNDTIKQGLRYAILDVVGYFQEYFYRLIDEMYKKGHSTPKMDLGIGLAGGTAWKLDYGAGQIDYAGRPLNIAARLQARARPNGIYIDASSFARNYLIERKCAREGGTKRIEIEGVGEVQVWFSTERTLRLRKSGMNEATEWVQADPYVERPKEGSDETARLALTELDIKTLLETREDLEADLAFRAAEQKSTDPSQYQQLNDLIKQMEALIDRDKNGEFRKVGQSFHEAIARLSSTDPTEAEVQVEKVRRLHDWTTKIYPSTKTDRRKMTEEHRMISEAIQNNSATLAARQMREHLERHHKRVIETAFIAT
ncbi:MAG TPA: FCD domain-containing protein [Pyrinomonadaceae bacterium]|nr:FCD domain-containing protein [Pyrinomonadaceae bacterium]